MADLLDATKTLIKDYGINDAKIKDQIFLVDEGVLDREVMSQNLKQSDVVLEIGPGFGYLTEKISKLCKVVAVETDVKLHSYLINKYELNEKVQLINADILSTVIPKFNKIISNPPYNIVDRIFSKLIHYDFESGTMVLPKNISEDLINDASNKKFPLVQRQFFEFSQLEVVPKESFYPQPRVISIMLKFSRKPKSLVQLVLKRDEMTVKNSIERAYQDIEMQTKRESRASVAAIQEKLGELGKKEVKKLDYQEISKLIEALQS